MKMKKKLNPNHWKLGGFTTETCRTQETLMRSRSYIVPCFQIQSPFLHPSLFLGVICAVYYKCADLKIQQVVQSLKMNITFIRLISKFEYHPFPSIHGQHSGDGASDFGRPMMENEGKALKISFDPTEIQVGSRIGALDCTNLLGNSMAISDPTDDLIYLRIFERRATGLENFPTLDQSGTMADCQVQA
ncbi:hypothetical protein L6452_13180 [Arctium lappa]|uniref:Uncharacterized protein n=1 Tax=Arctium lappa TaxID=4217 RepID=A0ACB9CHE7_ARCLA|nr:hypothetical protein L6452_13180 [Arctium lappa]